MASSEPTEPGPGHDHGSSPIAVFDDVHCFVPRCRYEMKISVSTLHLRGKSFDDRISMSSIQQLFLLNQNDGLHVYFVVQLNTPIKRGKTEHHYLVFNFLREEKTQFVLHMAESELQSLFKGRLKHEQSGYKYRVICNIIRVLSEFASGREISISKPSKFFSSYIDCFYTKQLGSLVFLSDGLIFLPNPPKFISFQNIKNMYFDSISSSISRYFDLVIDTWTDERVVFTNIRATIKPRLKILALNFEIPIKHDLSDFVSKRAVFLDAVRSRVRTHPTYTEPEDSDENGGGSTSSESNSDDSDKADSESESDSDTQSGTKTYEQEQSTRPSKSYSYLPFTSRENYSRTYNPNAQPVILMEPLDSILKRSHSRIEKNSSDLNAKRGNSSSDSDEQKPLHKTIKLEAPNKNSFGFQLQGHSHDTSKLKKEEEKKVLKKEENKPVLTDHVIKIKGGTEEHRSRSETVQVRRSSSASGSKETTTERAHSTTEKSPPFDRDRKNIFNVELLIKHPPDLKVEVHKRSLKPERSPDHGPRAETSEHTPSHTHQNFN